MRCIVSDTAGVRKDSSTGDIIEVEGMKRARKKVDAHVLVCMVDASDQEGGTSAINDVVDEDNGQSVLLLHNKIDLVDMYSDSSSSSNSGNTSKDSLQNLFSDAETYEISCVQNTGVDKFIEALTGKVISRVTSNNDDEQTIEDEGTVITRARHRRHVLSASQALNRFYTQSGEGYMAIDLAAEELRLAASELGRITGAVDVEDVLDVLFSDFCIGK